MTIKETITQIVLDVLNESGKDFNKKIPIKILNKNDKKNIPIQFEPFDKIKIGSSFSKNNLLPNQLNQEQKTS